jgi:hypothetical protein
VPHYRVAGRAWKKDEELLKVDQAKLDKSGLAAFKEALAPGYSPVSGEKWGSMEEEFDVVILGSGSTAFAAAFAAEALKIVAFSQYKDPAKLSRCAECN